MDVNIKDQSITLLPQRAALWNDQQTLLLSDIHIGKAATMQKAGVPVPEGVMEEDLRLLSDLIKQVNAKRCIIVGDLIHSSAGLTSSVANLFSHWLQQISIPVELVFGNHDRALIQSLPSGWSLNTHKDQLILPPFCFRHIPGNHPDYFVWSGHIHPQILLSSRHDALVLRCFQIFSSQAILPAFSRFVGGSFVKKRPGCRLFVTTGETVIEI